MQTLRIHKESVPAFVEALKAWGTLYAPVERGKSDFSIEQIDDVSKVRPEAVRTLLPFKKLLLKPKFTMLAQVADGSASIGQDNDSETRVYYGAHPCDIHALKILDLMYLSDFEDPFYKRNREHLTIVGYGCWPDEKCFCASLGTSTVDENFDLFLTPLTNTCLVTVASARGDDIVRANPGMFEPATREDTLDYMERRNQRQNAFQLSVDVSDLPYLLELKKDDPIWETLGNRCLCCGSCSMVCPTCTCFNVMDENPVEGRATRIRTWDSCLYKDYAMVAGGHSFRASRADRVKNRYYHKQEAFVREFGLPSCVGCGRCIDNCPTGINVVDVFRSVRGDL